MTGKRGFSGKCHTPEARQARRAAAIQGGNAAAGRTSTPPERPAGSVEHSPALLAAVPDAVDYPFPVPDGLAAKDLMEFLLKRKKVEQAEVELQEAKSKLALTNGRQIPRADLDRAIKRIRDAWWREAQQIPGMVLPRLADVPAEFRARVKQAIDAEVAAAADRVKASMA